MTILQALSITEVGALLLLGTFIFLKRYKEVSSFIYFLLTLSISGWIISIFFLNLSGDILWAKLMFLFPGIIATLFPAFAYVFPEKPRPSFYKIFLWVATLLGCVLIFLPVFDGLIVKEVFAKGGKIVLKYGSWHPFWGISFIFIMVSSLWVMRNKYISYPSGSVYKLQIKYFFIGTLLSFSIASVTNLVIPLISPGTVLREVGPLSLIFNIVFTAYAIEKHYLFKIKILLTELTIGGLAWIMLIDLLVSESIEAKAFRGFLLLVFIYLGKVTIESVNKEIESRKRVEKALHELEIAYKKLEELNRAKTEFIAMTSHQLRTPLSIIKGYLSMVLEGTYGDVPQKIRAPLANVYKSNERLIKLVNDLLNISRVDTGKIELKIEKVDINELIEDILRELGEKAKEKGLKVYFHKNEEIPPLFLDALKIREAISVVVDNAIKYTEKGWIKITITKTKEGVEIQVKDTGVGLTEDEKERIFESFSRGRAGINMDVEGAGLGLYLAKKYIEIHGGRIWAESEGKNKGSTFYIFLPFKNSLARKKRK